MITLDYSINKAPPEGMDLKEVDESELHYDLFLGDIVFRVDGYDLSTRWGWIPVLDFAACVFQISENLQPGVCESFEFTESSHRIDFILNGETVEIRTTYGVPSVYVPHGELRLSTKQFLKRLIEDLSAKYTTLKHNAFIRRLCAE
ncbi:hypothetical protein WME91_29020 [Sorangium sp. So ce269]